MRNVAGKVVETIKKHILCSKKNPPPEYGAVYEIMWKNML